MTISFSRFQPSVGCTQNCNRRMCIGNTACLFDKDMVFLFCSKMQLSQCQSVFQAEELKELTFSSKHYSQFWIFGKLCFLLWNNNTNNNPTHPLSYCVFSGRIFSGWISRFILRITSFCNSGLLDLKFLCIIPPHQFLF